jgi:hypothetical protein
MHPVVPGFHPEQCSAAVLYFPGVGCKQQRQAKEKPPGQYVQGDGDQSMWHLVQRYSCSGNANGAFTDYFRPSTDYRKHRTTHLVL